MTTPEPTPAAEPDDSTPTAEPDDVELPQDLEAARRLRSEAANLRKRNRELEAAHESDLARLATYEKGEVERAAATVLVDPEDVWRYIDAETQQSWYDTEFGEIVPDRVRDAARALAESKPHLARRDNAGPPPSNRPIEGLRGGASPEPKKTEVTWSSALRRG